MEFIIQNYLELAFFFFYPELVKTKGNLYFGFLDEN